VNAEDRELDGLRIGSSAHGLERRAYCVSTLVGPFSQHHRAPSLQSLGNERDKDGFKCC
jgi:hypothetical protein